MKAHWLQEASLVSRTAVWFLKAPGTIPFGIKIVKGLLFLSYRFSSDMQLRFKKSSNNDYQFQKTYSHIFCRMTFFEMPQRVTVAELYSDQR